ncbi:MAG: phosphoenolpyruvate carboxykinase [Anaeroplasmataceae bacterium]
MEYVTGKRQVVLNFSEKFCETEIEVLNSDCFKDVWGRYIKKLYETENQAFLPILSIFPRKTVVNKTIDLFKLLLSFELEEIEEMSPLYAQAISMKDRMYDMVQHFYDYWRRLERYAVVITRNVKDGVESTSFVEAQSKFNNVILSTYRTICEKLFGSKFPIYRQLPAGVNAALLLSRNEWMDKNSEYAFLAKVDAIEQIVIRPPFISYSAKNKRTGTYPEAKVNPMNRIKENFNAKDYYCYAAKVGSALAYIYFHRDFLAHGITIGNLFEFVPLSACKGQKPDLLYVFGGNYEPEDKTKDGSEFYYDKENDIYVGLAPNSKEVDYFGYMKKMLLTLYNTKMIDQGYLPIHGACVHITMKNGKTKNVVIMGDSGAGKSESLEALAEMAGDNISAQLTIFDDMGTFKIENGKVMAYGTEIGAFVRTDDMAAGYAYREMDRAIFMNPDKQNSRLVVPVATYPQIMKGYEVDYYLYANNYEEEYDDAVEFYSTAEEAKEIFIRGARRAKGTTQETGMTESFFANPFGPVQRESQTRVIIDEVFKALFKSGVKVGNLHTALAVPGMEHEGPAKAAKRLFEILGE